MTMREDLCIYTGWLKGQSLTARVHGRYDTCRWRREYTSSTTNIHTDWILSVYDLVIVRVLTSVWMWTCANGSWPQAGPPTQCPGGLWVAGSQVWILPFFVSECWHHCADGTKSPVLLHTALSIQNTNTHTHKPNTLAYTHWVMQTWPKKKKIPGSIFSAHIYIHVCIFAHTHTHTSGRKNAYVHFV